MKPKNLLGKIKLFTWFTRTREKTDAGNATQAQMQQPTDSTLIYTYQNCPLDIFMVSLDNGNPDLEIYEQFFDTIKDKEQEYIQKLVKEINLSEFKYNLITVGVRYFECAAILKRERDEEVLAILSRMIIINKNDSLKIIVARSKRFLEQIDTKRKELEALAPGSNKGGKKADSEYFNFLIVQISKYMKFFVDKRVVTVAQFAQMILDLRKECEAMELLKMKNGSRSGR